MFSVVLMWREGLFTGVYMSKIHFIELHLRFVFFLYLLYLS